MLNWSDSGITGLETSIASIPSAWNSTAVTSLTLNSTSAEFHSQAPTQRVVRELTMGTLLLLTIYLLLNSLIYRVCRKEESALERNNNLLLLSCVLLLTRICWIYISEAVQASDPFCKAHSTINVLLANLSSTIISCILWLRQYSFYNQPVLGHLSSNRLKRFSQSTLVTIVIISVLHTGLLLTLPVTGDDVSCAHVAPAHFLLVLLPITYLLNGLSQLVLLALVLYPILKHLQTSKSVRRAGLESVVVKLCVATGVCVISDIAFIMVAMLNPGNLSFNFLAICYCYNTLVNILALLSSFSDWKARLVPFLPFRSAPTVTNANHRSSPKLPTSKATIELPI